MSPVAVTRLFTSLTRVVKSGCVTPVGAKSPCIQHSLVRVTEEAVPSINLSLHPVHSNPHMPSVLSSLSVFQVNLQDLSLFVQMRDLR